MYICDPLSKNLALHAFYENQDKTGNRYINVQSCDSEKMEAIGSQVMKQNALQTWNVFTAGHKFHICDPLSETQHIPHFMKIEIRADLGISMFNCVAVKKWK